MQVCPSMHFVLQCTLQPLDRCHFCLHRWYTMSMSLRQQSERCPGIPQSLQVTGYFFSFICVMFCLFLIIPSNSSIFLTRVCNVDSCCYFCWTLDVVLRFIFPASSFLQIPPPWRESLLTFSQSLGHLSYGAARS